MGSNVIGIVGGVGPLAGINAVEKVFRNTIANSDQDHLDVILISKPFQIADRTSFLTNQDDLVNPAVSLINICDELISLGAGVIGIPCNTAHAEKIFSLIEDEFREKDVVLVNMIDQVIKHIEENLSHIKRVGILTTIGLDIAKTYQNKLIAHNLIPVTLKTTAEKQLTHSAIYDSIYGIKSTGAKIDMRSVKNIKVCMELLIKDGAEIIILGCTELPLAITASEYLGVPLIDSIEILSRALVKFSEPSKLKPWRLE